MIQNQTSDSRFARFDLFVPNGVVLPNKVPFDVTGYRRPKPALTQELTELVQQSRAGNAWEQAVLVVLGATMVAGIVIAIWSSAGG